MDRKCQECGKGGATESGICLGCANQALAGKPMKSQAGKIVQDRFKKINKVLNEKLSGLSAGVDGYFMEVVCK
ncbi:MAG: hypothetical protein DDT22_00229 [candidate division WS2 bacterium]|nr:hypothetical protein [Candidatus Lithacetigena glycinireducens]